MSDLKKRPAYLDTLSPEERAAHIKKMQLARVEARTKKLQENNELQKKAMEILPEIVAQSILRESLDENWEPAHEMVEKFRLLTEKGYTIDELRAGHFKSIDNKTWDKLIRALFKNHVPQLESLGIDIISSRQKAVKMLKRRAGMIRREMKRYRDNNKATPPALFRELSNVEDRLHDVEIELAQVLNRIGLVGDKSKSSAIHVHINTPRPKEEKAIDITPTKED
jgi:hypothetical protein